MLAVITGPSPISVWFFFLVNHTSKKEASAARGRLPADAHSYNLSTSGRISLSIFLLHENLIRDPFSMENDGVIIPKDAHCVEIT